MKKILPAVRILFILVMLLLGMIHSGYSRNCNVSSSGISPAPWSRFQN